MTDIQLRSYIHINLDFKFLMEFSDVEKKNVLDKVSLEMIFAGECLNRN